MVKNKIMKKQELCIGDWVWNPQNQQAEQVVELREHQAMLAYNDLYDYSWRKPHRRTYIQVYDYGYRNRRQHIVV